MHVFTCKLAYLFFFDLQRRNEHSGIHQINILARVVSEQRKQEEMRSKIRNSFVFIRERSHQAVYRNLRKDFDVLRKLSEFPW